MYVPVMLKHMLAQPVGRLLSYWYITCTMIPSHECVQLHKSQCAHIGITYTHVLIRMYICMQ